MFFLFTLATQCVIVRTFFFLQPKSEILLPLEATIFAAWNWKYKMIGNMLRLYSLLIAGALTFE